MVDFIELSTRNHVSETTLQRLWGYSTRKADVVSVRTLDVLSKVAGCKDWEDFCRNLKETSREESEFFSGDTIDSSSLEVGDRLTFGWGPDRMCTVRYLGENRFVCESSQNSKMKEGDTFSALQFQKGRELYLDHFKREGESEKRYVVGDLHGLTVLYRSCEK